MALRGLGRRIRAKIPGGKFFNRVEKKIHKFAPGRLISGAMQKKMGGDEGDDETGDEDMEARSDAAKAMKKQAGSGQIEYTGTGGIE